MRINYVNVNKGELIPSPMNVDLTEITVEHGFNLKEDRFEGTKMQSNIQKHRATIMYAQNSMTPVPDPLLEYYGEVAELVHKTTNADIVFVNGHLSRSAALGKIDNANKPSIYAHTDYNNTETNLWEIQKNFYRSQLENKQPIPKNQFWINGSREDAIECKRMEAYNVWRNLSDDENVDHPLCFCHPSSMDFENDILYYPYEYTLANGYKGKNPIGFLEGDQKKANKHKWYSYTKLDHDESVIFKQYDSGTSEKDYSIMHTTTVDALGKTPRQSIEVRVWCYYA